MAAAASASLFYSPSLGKKDLEKLALGFFLEETVYAAQDLVDFPEEEGGDDTRELALPFLPGMDEVQVDQAQIKLRVQPKDLDITGFSVTAGPNNQGIFLSLNRPARLKKVELSYSPPNTGVIGIVHVVVRTAQKQGGGYAPGPPVFADPAFPAPGPMFGSVLAGLTVQDLGGDRKLLLVPGVQGDAWLIQLATGDSPTDLSPLAVSPTVNRVVIDAAPENLSVVMQSDKGDITLWNHPDLLLPEVGVQEVNFTPMAQKHLTDRLTAVAGSADPITLPVPLKFHSDRGAAVGIVSKTLSARYLARPLEAEPMMVRLGGTLTGLRLSAPAGLNPEGSSVNFTAKLLGRELNQGSPEPPLAPPGAGWRVNEPQAVAGAASFLPLAGGPPGSLVSLASACLFLSAREAAEAVLEIRADAASTPGPVLTQPLVRQIQPGFSGWLEFELPQPLEVKAGQSPLWLVLRTTRGELFWFAHGGGETQATQPALPAVSVRVSKDKGKTWGLPETGLVAPGPTLAQLFHVSPEPLAPPVIRMQQGGNILSANVFANPVQKGLKEYVATGASLPAGLHNLLAAASGQIRATTDLILFSASVMDLTIENLTLYYDPFQVKATGV